MIKNDNFQVYKLKEKHEFKRNNSLKVFFYEFVFFSSNYSH